MKTSLILFLGALFISISSYVGTNSGIQTVQDLLKVQNFFGLLGVIGSVLVAWASRSPVTVNGGLISKMTGNGDVPVPKDVN